MKQKVQKSAEEKLAIVLEGIKGEATITDLCIKHGVSQACIPVLFESNKKISINTKSKNVLTEVRKD